MEHWWRMDDYQDWHRYKEYEILTIDEVVHIAKLGFGYEIAITIISDTEFYIYVFAHGSKDRLHNTCHFKRCIKP